MIAYKIGVAVATVALSAGCAGIPTTEPTTFTFTPEPTPTVEHDEAYWRGIASALWSTWTYTEKVETCQTATSYPDEWLEAFMDNAKQDHSATEATAMTSAVADLLIDQCPPYLGGY